MASAKAKAKPAPAVQTETASIVCFKAFDDNWKGRGFQFEVGKTYEHKGKVVVCQSGFHAVTVPFDAWNYYEGAKNLARCSAADPKGHTEDSKIVTAKLTIEASLTLPEWIKAQASAVVDLCRKAAGALACAPRECAAATGNSGHAAATGNSGHAAATGDRGHAAATGKHACAFAPGYAGLAMAGETGAIFLAEIADDYSIKSVFASKVGESGIKPNVWYVLKDGKPTEVKP